MEGHAMVRGEEDEEHLRRSKLEEALEVESLRRIICAYINYPDASEEDVKRYERSYNTLPPAHKALLSHYPLKFQKLRKCISMNYAFICNMLEAFEPPFDMRQDADISEDSHSHQHNLCSGDGNDCSCLPMSTSGRMCHNHSDQNCCKGSDLDGKSSCNSLVNEEVAVEVRGDSISENHPQHYSKESDKHDGNADSNGNVVPSSHECLGSSFQLDVPLVDVDKVRCIIRNIVRDWAEEGQRERDQCYKPILEELDRLFPNRNENPPTCLVPGAGLGRLALEISCLGFISQGNEFSYYMMICSSFILNQTETAGEWTIYPWIHSNCNSLSDSDQLRPVSIPDIHPASAGITEGFSMCGGDFVEVYGDKGHEGEWDAVVTSFFIDTAHNIVEYIEIISRILKDGGVWINLGPLLYHFADMYGQGDEMSIELSLEDVKRTAMHFGLEIEKERTVKTTYTTNPKSMMQNWYYTAFWTMRKKSGPSKEKCSTPVF